MTELGSPPPLLPATLGLGKVPCMNCTISKEGGGGGFNENSIILSALWATHTHPSLAYEEAR
jgi:hypothetical protein